MIESVGKILCAAWGLMNSPRPLETAPIHDLLGNRFEKDLSLKTADLNALISTTYEGCCVLSVDAERR